MEPMTLQALHAKLGVLEDAWKEKSLELLCETLSPIRPRGDNIAHPTLTKAHLHDLQHLQMHIHDSFKTPTQQEGMKVIVNFFITKVLGFKDM